MIIALILIFIITPLLPLLPSQHWSIRFFDFVRIQSIVIQVLILLSAIIFWEQWQSIQWVLIAALVLVLTYQCHLVRPYTPFYHRRKPEQAFAPKKLKLLTANVLQTNTNYNAFIKIVKDTDPDIVVTMESDKKWKEALSKPFTEYKHRLEATLDNFYGMHLYSKIPFDKAKIKYLVEADVPSMHCELTYADQTFNLIVIHPAPPSPTENETAVERDAELMIVGKICREQGNSTVVCGDLNDVVWSRTSRLFKKMTGYFDPRVGRGLYPSFHANIWLLRFPLDHLFYSKDMHVPVMKRLPRFGSDHFAMYYELAFPLVDIDVENPELTREEQEEINALIEEAE
ncbi:endonuclease/exonuclease/phosphatase family protein [Dokdonia sinensis]|uniref:endonuclease/exonuclease/phosphatase family protein n=1 Tax=Dokdonia sinensis TaxID=2479847 RepID=UPI001F1AEF12|nr:endonuclease/exonuclease/phosphatase family protein [Dokdonia sinensis]